MYMKVCIWVKRLSEIVADPLRHTIPVSIDDALGPLNPVERKYAPDALWLDGDRDLLRMHPRVAVIGTRTPSVEGC